MYLLFRSGAQRVISPVETWNIKKCPSEAQNVKATTSCMPVFHGLMHEGSKAHYFSVSKVRSTKGLKEKNGG